MKNKENILVVKQKTWYVYIIILILFIGIDFSIGFQLFEDLTLYYSLFYAYIIAFLYFSFSARKITLTHELLIFEYYLWFKWRRKIFNVNDIKSFYFYSNRGISIEINLHSRVKSVNFFLLGFREKSISELYHELYNHPLNKLESGFE